MDRCFGLGGAPPRAVCSVNCAPAGTADSPFRERMRRCLQRAQPGCSPVNSKAAAGGGGRPAVLFDAVDARACWLAGPSERVGPSKGWLL
jgi:hypothetical protein